MDLVIKNGTVVTATAVFPADIAIHQGKIAAIGQDLSGERTISAAGKLVVPGGVDIHTHLQYHVGGFDTADDFASGTRAAAFGGTTTVMDFVETHPEETMAQALERRKSQAAAGSCLDFSLHMSILPSDMSKLGQIPALIANGCPTFKHYMAYGFALNDAQLLQSFQAIAQAGGTAIVHAENWDIIQTLIEQSLAQGHVHPRFHPLCRPAAFEGQAVGKALDIAALAQARLFIFHITCREAVERLSQARHRGQPAWGETCPHYTCLDSDVFEKLGPLPICAPPIRESAQRQALVNALVNGDIQSVSTDHCPFTVAEKHSATTFNRVPGGMTSIETRMMLIKNLPGMTLERWVDCCCTTPARLMGLEHKGQIAPGFDADIVLWDNAGTHTIKQSALHEAADWNAYEGVTLQGKPETVISRGQIIVQDGEFLAHPGQGHYIERHLA